MIANGKENAARIADDENTSSRASREIVLPASNLAADRIETPEEQDIAFGLCSFGLGEPEIGLVRAPGNRERGRTRRIAQYFKSIKTLTAYAADYPRMRDVEDPLFDATAQWLDRDPSNAFTLVVDELHSYRGTQGTEVALVVRNLLRRLGIQPGSPQLRCIATSASLAGEDGREFLEGFFGEPRDSFEIIPGDPRPARPAVVLPVGPFTGLTSDASEQDPRAIAEAHAVGEALASACAADDARPKPLSEVSRRLFGEGAPAAALEGALRAVSAQRVGFEAPRFRSHHFIRMIRGLWACADPACTEVRSEERSPARLIGRIYTTPRTRCPCGGRVLELLYCYQCGEPFLGGHVTNPDATPDRGWWLNAGPRSVPAREVQLVFRRPYGQYMWYWPRSAPPGLRRWTHSLNGQRVAFEFAPATLDPYLGHLRPAGARQVGAGVGTYLRVTPREVPGLQIPALPERCPHCAQEGRNRPEIFFRGTVRTPRPTCP